jgi:hypothetical protein
MTYRISGTGGTATFSLNAREGDKNYTLEISPTNMNPYYLALDKKGDYYTGYYSSNGTNWTKLGVVKASLNNPKSGFYATLGIQNVTGFTATAWSPRFSNFTIRQYSVGLTIDPGTNGWLELLAGETAPKYAWAYTTFSDGSKGSVLLELPEIDTSVSGDTTVQGAVAGNSAVTVPVTVRIYDNGPIVVVTGPKTLMLSDKTATYKFSLENMPEEISLITLSFKVEDAFFYGQSVKGLNGWEAVLDSGWAPDGDTHWVKEVMLVKAGGAAAGDYDFLEVVLEYRGALGTTQVEIVGATAAAPSGEIPLRIGKPAVTVIDPYSIYDVNRDGAVDLADVAAAAYFFLRTSEDDDWTDFVDFEGVKVSAARCDVSGDGKVDIEDLILIMCNYS